MTSEMHLFSVSRTASQIFGILKKPWRVFHDRLILGRCFRGPPHCSAVWCSAADTRLKLPRIQWCQFLNWGWVCLNVTLQIVDLWQYYVCCTRSCLTRCTLFVVPYLGRTYTRCFSRTSVHSASHRYRPSSFAELLLPCQYRCGAILVTPYSMVWDWRV